ncbi:hypothetical protein Pint_26430 [Pistacia integerrima]|uniref:Uncharacterized protein n=1 Tax=Pistacia integerrima TaxID=434235 RepID=A0ACC0YCT0_9ROSI|nr:hypothetical protein Pint_26430 [Pistacia integerrima]
MEVVAEPIVSVLFEELVKKLGSSKALNLATRPRFNFSMWLKIKKINSQLEQLRKEASEDFILKKGITGGTSSAVSEGLRPEETSSVPPEQTVHGRHEDETKLLELVKMINQVVQINFE